MAEGGRAGWKEGGKAEGWKLGSDWQGGGGKERGRCAAGRVLIHGSSVSWMGSPTWAGIVGYREGSSGKALLSWDSRATEATTLRDFWGWYGCISL